MGRVRKKNGEMGGISLGFVFLEVGLSQNVAQG
jgi:hypothetical protein